MTSRQPATLRTFVAVELPAPVRGYLGQLQEALRRQPWTRDLRWLDPDSIHLTLNFLGDTPEDRIPTITKALERVAQARAPFILRTGGLGRFPPRGSVRVLWVGLVGQGLDALRALQQDVEKALGPLGFPAEGRGFSPHLTLARVRRNGRVDGRALEDFDPSGTAEQTTVPVTSIVLMKSDLRPQGAVYIALWRGGLG